jgi:glycosyltransferase involved in cell wall biosynthesis
MRVLHLPSNIASQIGITVRALRRCGVDARGLVIDATKVQDSSGLIILPMPPPGMPRWNRMMIMAANALVMIRHIFWADVLHWHYGSSSLAQRILLLIAKWLGRRQFVEFWGSDVRIPEIEASNNPHYAAVLGRHEYRKIENRRNSYACQRNYHRVQARVLQSVGMDEHLHPLLLKNRHRLIQRVETATYQASYPDPSEPTPIIAHAPTAPVIKGTDALVAAVTKLQSHVPLRFDLIHGVPRQEALARVARCDIFVDQLRIGHHGLAALEAMALGKPVVAFIKPAMLRQYPVDLPIVVANPDTIDKVLEELLRDGARRRRLGEAGRAYVLRHHDADVLALRLKSLYAQSLTTRA